jgi:hypothetical protein
MLPLAHDPFYASKECLLIALLGYFVPGDLTARRPAGHHAGRLRRFASGSGKTGRGWSLAGPGAGALLQEDALQELDGLPVRTRNADGQ